MIIASAYPYTGNGLGGLPDALEAIVTHEINGQYELYFRYPLTGLHYEELQSGKIVMAKPDDITDEQPFRIYRITKPLNGVVTVYARHLCYDLQGIVVEPFTAGSLTEAMLTIPTKCTPSSPITLQTTRTVASGITLNEPRPLWRLLGGQEGSLLDVYGGEWDFDKLDATLVTQLGQDRGVNIRYGKNLTELEQDATIEASYSGVFPYWYDEETSTLVTLTEKVVAVTGSVVTDRNLVLDCSDDFDTQPTEQQLRDRANAYIAANSVGNLKSSWKVSFVDTEDFIDKVALGDTLHVYYEALGVNATARAVKTEYDVLKGKYKSITVGRVKQNLAAIIVNDKKETDEKIKTTKSYLEQVIDEATYSITHGGGVFRAIYDGYNLKEIVSLDDPDITQALSVWRWNNGGFGHSSTGYNGQYTLALLPDGSINAEVITTGILNANIIRAGILQDAAGKNSWNLDTGILTITDGKIIATNTKVYNHADYSQADLDRIQSIAISSIVPTEADFEKYDINEDGVIRTSDLIIVRNMILNSADITKTTTTTIDPSASGQAIKVEVTCTGSYTNSWTSTFAGRVLSVGAINGTAVSATESVSVGSSGIAGTVKVRDSSNNLAAVLRDDGLLFQNSSLVETAFYPSTGLPMLSPSSAVNYYSNTGKVINLGELSRTDLGLSSTSATETEVITAFLAYICSHYTSAVSCIFEAVIVPNSKRMMQCFVYDTSVVSGGLPQYATGTMLYYNGTPYIFGTSSYSVFVHKMHDYVVEEGASGSWSYRKWKSGVYECWMRKTMSIAVSSAWQSSYYGQVAAQSYPVTFNSSPYEQVSVTGGDGWAWVSGGAALPTTTTTGVYYLVRPASTSAQNYTLDYYVRGTVSS